MYWNLLKKGDIVQMIRLIETWDVLKLLLVLSQNLFASD